MRPIVNMSEDRATDIGTWRKSTTLVFAYESQAKPEHLMVHVLKMPELNSPIFLARQTAPFCPVVQASLNLLFGRPLQVTGSPYAIRDHCPICPVCNVGVLWPNGWMDQDATWYGGRLRPRQHCVRWEPSSPRKVAQQPPPRFQRTLLWHGRPSQQLLSSCHYGLRSWRKKRTCFRPHRSTTYVDAAYCYRRSSVVCLSICQNREPCKNG